MAKKIVIDVEFKGIDGAAQRVGEVVEETKTLKQQFRDAQKELQTLAGAEVVDEEKLNAAINKVSKLKDEMNGVNEEVAIFASESKFEVLSNRIGDIGGKIASLDFKGANESASKLLNFSNSITFAEAGKGLKDLGGTFFKLGQALLTNPLFLLAAIITGIVVAIVKLLDKAGLLKTIMNAIGKVFEFFGDIIDAVAQGIRDFVDIFMGGALAAEDAAQRQADAAEKTAAAYEEKSDSIIQGLDHQIRMLELEGKSTEHVERKKVYYIMQTAQARAKADRLALQSARMRGDLDEEELKELEDKYRASQTAFEKSIQDVELFNKKVKVENDNARQEELDAQKDAQEKSAQKAKEYRDKQIQERKAALDKIKEAEIEYTDSLLSEEDRQIKAAENKYNTLINLAKKYGQDISILEKAKEDALMKIRQDALAKEQEDMREGIDELVKRTEQKLTINTTSAKNEAEIMNNITQAGVNVYLDAVNKKIEAERKEKNEALDTHMFKLGLANKYANAVSSLSEGIFALTNRLGSKEEKAAEQRARRQFAINKTLQLSTAIISGIQSVMAAYKNGMNNPIPLLGPATAGVYAAVAGAISAGNIAKIAATKFETKSNPGGGDNPGGGNPPPNVVSPTFNTGALFSTGGQSTQMIGSQQSTTAATPPIKTYVVEQDITGAQQRMSNIKQQASI